jgi:hypothetical protein
MLARLTAMLKTKFELFDNKAAASRGHLLASRLHRVELRRSVWMPGVGGKEAFPAIASRAACCRERTVGIWLAHGK